MIETFRPSDWAFYIGLPPVVYLAASLAHASFASRRVTGTQRSMFIAALIGIAFYAGFLGFFIWDPLHLFAWILD